MASQVVSVLCGNCKVSVEGPANPEPQDILTCPKCGRSDNFKNVMASVEKHSLELMENKLHDTIKRSLSGSKSVKIDSKPPKKGIYPFITDLRF